MMEFEELMDKKELYSFVATRTSQCRILVAGDVMLDKYYYSEVTRISPEAPVPIAHVQSEMETLGGAANVAHNLTRLACQVSIAGFVGKDYHGKSLLEKLRAARRASFRDGAPEVSPCERRPAGLLRMTMFSSSYRTHASKSG